MCKLDGTKCDTCYEMRINTDSGMILNFTYDERDVDNTVIKSWFLSTEFVDSVEVRKVGDTVWSIFTYAEYQEEVGLNG